MILDQKKITKTAHRFRVLANEYRAAFQNLQHQSRGFMTRSETEWADFLLKLSAQYLTNAEKAEKLGAKIAKRIADGKE